ncbi:hypothetical protein [Paraburkholderia ferrariae]|uniref:hypothetical protein n=1 Tax=Paraburkholderia ferrariae TaxID=386056 RepID=UPI0012EB31F9|nr:hypothetical protein [Paraburkholderia ferrariae]
MRAYKIIVLLIFGLFSGAKIRAEGMCNADEAVIFNCELKKTTASLCRSKKDNVLTYRDGGRAGYRLVLSDAGKSNLFFFSNIPYAGGGEGHIRFSNNDYNYYIYDKTVKTDEGPIFSAGIVIYHNDLKIANMMCNNDASIRRDAYQNFPRENYKNIGAK